MQLHQIKISHKRKHARRVARGGKRGGYSGRGIKGQRSRAGAKIRPAIRDLIKKIPKLRGRGKNIFKSFRAKAVVVGVSDLDNKFIDGGVVSVPELIKVGLVKSFHGKVPRVKILGNGSISKKVTVRGVEVSRSAKAKIEKIGGAVL